MKFQRGIRNLRIINSDESYDSADAKRLSLHRHANDCRTVSSRLKSRLLPTFGNVPLKYSMLVHTTSNEVF